MQIISTTKILYTFLLLLKYVLYPLLETPSLMSTTKIQTTTTMFDFCDDLLSEFKEELRCSALGPLLKDYGNRKPPFECFSIKVMITIDHCTNKQLEVRYPRDNEGLEHHISMEFSMYNHDIQCIVNSLVLLLTPLHFSEITISNVMHLHEEHVISLILY